MEKIMDGLEMTVVGMGTVFAVLIILYVVMVLMRIFLYKEEGKTAPSQGKQEPAKKKVPAVKEEEEMNEEELIAVLTAAVAASLNQSTYNLQIKSFRRIGQVSPVWNTVSRKEQIENQL